MKTTLQFIPLAALLGTAVVPALAQTTATPQELHVRTDLDGDSTQDIVIINRADGSFRVGYQTQPGQHTWSESRASGVPGASWASVGRHLGYTKSLAVSSATANRVSVFTAPSATSAVVPQFLAAAGVGPAGVISVDLGGVGNTADDDLVLLTGLNDAPNQHRRETVRHNPGVAQAFTPMASTTGGEFQASGRAKARTLGVEYAAVLEGTASSATFRLLNPTTGTLTEAASVSAVPGSGFVSTAFTASPFGGNHTFLFWQHGMSQLAFRGTTATGRTGVEFTAGGSFETGRPIGEVLIVGGGFLPRVMVISSDGSSAAVFDFNGTTATQVQALTAPQGSSFTGAAATPNGFALLTGAPNSGLSTAIRPYAWNGTSYDPGTVGDLPGRRPASTAANVFLFTSEPFVAPNAGLVSVLNAPDWTRSVQLAGSPSSITATTEIYTGPTTGLGSPAPHPLGNTPGGATHALPNQYRPYISIASLEQDLGPAAAIQASIQPAGGAYNRAVIPRVTATGTVGSVFARLGNGPWTPAAAFSPKLLSDSTVQFYAVNSAGTVKTPVRTVVYTFTKAQHEIDSDSDGVPDFVENFPPAIPGKDPNNSRDTDEDGFTDLEEWLRGSNPNDANSPAPVNGQPPAHLATVSGLHVKGQLLPLDGTNGLRTKAAEGVLVEAHTPSGQHIAGDNLRLTVPGFPNTPAFEVRDIITDAPLISVLSQPVFDITTLNANKSRGRELGALVPVNRPAVLAINYTPSGLGNGQEVAAWVAAAQAANNAQQPQTATISPTEHHTLAALLLELWLNQVAVQRNLEGATMDNVTVFPSRSGDENMRFLTGEEWLDLSRRISQITPGWNVRDVLQAIDTAVVPPAAVQYAGLKSVATDIYRVSSLLAVGDDAPDYLPPLETLRVFLRTGQLPAAYAAASSLTPAVRTAAHQSVTPLLAGLASRPVVTVDMEVVNDSFSGPCPVLTAISGIQGDYNLISVPGVPFVMPGSFRLVPGSQVRIMGHLDVNDPSFDGPELQVLSLTLTHVPQPVERDLDGNVLNDAWQNLVGGSGPFRDTDADGFSNLQELLDGTDPMNPNSRGLMPENLAPPTLEISLVDGQPNVAWQYPANYAGRVDFFIQKSDALGGWITSDNLPTQQNGHYRTEMPPPANGRQFYRATMAIKQ